MERNYTTLVHLVRTQRRCFVVQQRKISSTQNYKKGKIGQAATTMAPAAHARTGHQRTTVIPSRGRCFAIIAGGGGPKGGQPPPWGHRGPSEEARNASTFSTAPCIAMGITVCASPFVSGTRRFSSKLFGPSLCYTLLTGGSKRPFAARLAGTTLLLQYWAHGA